jgi:branched-chain amino acid aminotransferase
VLDARIHHANLLNSILAKIEANNAGADDALMLDTRGFVAETNATHVFIVRNSDESQASGDLATGRVVACPEGITRATVIEICAAEKFDASRLICRSSMSMVRMKCFARGTMGELAGVIRIDNRQIGDGNVGPMTKRLSDLYAKRTTTEGVQVVDL